MPTGIYPRTEFHYEIYRKNQKKAVKANRGRIRLDMLGDKNLAKRPEVRAKISLKSKGRTSPNKGKPHSEEWKRKISQSHLGIKPSKETIEKLRISHLGQKGYWTGKKLKAGPRKYNLLNGYKTLEDKRIRHGFETRKWRQEVFLRDNWTCQKCLVRGGKLRAHHIQNFSQFIELRFDIYNGITFCEKCHKLFHKLYGLKNNNVKQIYKFLDIKI